MKLRRLLRGEPRLAERVEVLSMSAVGLRLAEARFGGATLATDDHVQGLVRQAAATVDASRFTPTFLWAEWRDVVDARNLRSWEEYRDVRRLGRKTRLPESQRATLWAVYEAVRASLAAASLMTAAEMYHTLAAHLRGARPVYDFAVVDEAQDVSIPQLRFLAALGGDRPEALFFAGDLGQRIFQQPFSWVSQGVDVRGRARTLHVNYRTSHQIRTSADRLLAATVTDVDGNTEDRKGTVSVFNGPPPDIRVFDDQDTEADAVAGWLSALAAQDVPPEEIGVFVRSNDQIERAQRAVERAGLLAHMLDRRLDAPDGHVLIGTMHLAKGLEFRAVAVMACDDEVIPLSSRIEAVGDEADLEEVFDTERHLLYVACTRARDHLLGTCGGGASEFLDDLLQTRDAGGQRA